MKKHYPILFLFLFLSFQGIIAQTELTYTVDFEWKRTPFCGNYTNYGPIGHDMSPCSYSWGFAENSQYLRHSEMEGVMFDDISNPPRIEKQTFIIPLKPSYEVRYNAICKCSSNSGYSDDHTYTTFFNYNSNENTYTCIETMFYRLANTVNESNNFSIENSVITGSSAYESESHSCFGEVSVKNFFPNGLVISKPGYDPYATGVYTPPEILAGEAFDLIATTPSVNTTIVFPDFVYHWQYRPEGSQTWEDVPNTVINTSKTNNTPKPIFTMRDLPWAPFGAIDFRLGYGPDDRAFTAVYRIIYKPGAPVVSNVVYTSPKCSGDPVTSIDVYFDRNLVSGESFSLFRIVPFPKVSGDAVRFSQPEITNLIYDPLKDQYIYSFIIPTSNNTLENNKQYVVEYQAALNGVPKGTMAEAEPFLYQDPEPLTFTIDPTNPLCHNGEGGMTINVKGGSGKYSYSLDGGTAIPFTVTTVQTSTTANNTTTISRSASQPVNLSINDAKKSYKIKVTDEHDCIEKSL
ncbi:SprB repeat-containing protein [Flavobacterium hydrophilum]|uniref:Uncharacterized protein n=1 Tax=Flavobacterium hydrophilum TaxID=2211445 RepID=A0A2V4C7V5_9FLAO|nr:SprB repeat-containing protein [Flavobacterium hydrophilum]PXY46020.1 hypothetical protein DMB68_02200 [Flavobacterium hydrophilum]